MGGEVRNEQAMTSTFSSFVTVTNCYVLFHTESKRVGRRNVRRERKDKAQVGNNSFQSLKLLL